MFNESVTVLTSFIGHCIMRILQNEASNFDDTEEIVTFYKNEEVRSQYKRVITMHK